MKALNISFEEQQVHYEPESVAKIEKSREDFKAGKYEVIETDDLWK